MRNCFVFAFLANDSPVNPIWTFLVQQQPYVLFLERMKNGLHSNESRAERLRFCFMCFFREPR